MFDSHTSLEKLLQYIVITLEAPNLESMDVNSAATNSVILLDRDTIDPCQVIDLKKTEFANCITCFEKKVGESKLSAIISGAGSVAGFVAIGSMFLDVEETYPTKGRILIYELDCRSNKLHSRHIENISGSVQAISIMKEDASYLVVGVNNEMQLY